MPTIKDKLHFNYGGISSKKFDLINVNTSNGMLEEQLIGSREINEKKINGNDTPYFSKVESAPREFDMNIAFTDFFTEERIEEVVLWLFQDRYLPLYFYDSPEKIFYCMPVGDTDLIHNSLRQGYITLKMRCNSPHIFSPVEVTPKYISTTSKIIHIANRGHVDIYPEISIKKIGNGDITLTHESFGSFGVLDLLNTEDIYINCEKELIETDKIGTYRYDNVIGQFKNIKLIRGVNKITIQGSCEVEFRYTFKYKF